MKWRKLINTFILIIMLIIVPNICKAASNYPNLETISGKYVINYEVYKKNNNLWCIQEGSHLTSYHSCLYEEYGSEQTIDVENETNENKIALAKAALEYSDDGVTESKYHSTAETTMQYLSNKAGFGGAYYGTGNSDEFLDYAKIIKKLNELKDSSPIELTANEESDGVYVAEFDEFSGLNSDEFNLTSTVIEGDGTVTVEPEGIINSSGNSAKIKISNPSDSTTQVKIKFSCKIQGPKILKYKTIRLAACSDSPDHIGVKAESLNVTARWTEVRSKLQAAGCTMSETAGYELWKCGCPNKGSMFVGEGALNTLNKGIHNCTYHHYLNHINDWSVNEQNLAMYYIEEGELEFEFEIIIKLENEPEIEIEVDKTWIGSTPDGGYPTINFTLLADGKVVSTVSITGNGSKKFENGSKGTKFPKTKDGKAIKYVVQENPSSGTVTVSGESVNWKVEGSSSVNVPSGGGKVSFKNKIDEPPPTPTPTPSEEPGDDEEVKITKTVEYVLSEYEGDTSSADGAGEGSKSARVQTGDQVVFKIVVESLREDEPKENKEDGEEGEWEDGEESSYGISNKPTEGNKVECTNKCHAGEKRKSWEEYSYKDSGNCPECGKPLGVRQTRSFGFKSLKLTDVLEDESKVKINKIFDGSYDHGSVSGFTAPEGTWTMSGSTFEWDSGIGDEEEGKKSATLYILCDVSEDWKYDDGKGNTCKNTATLTDVTWRVKKTRWYHWYQETKKYTSTHTTSRHHHPERDSVCPKSETCPNCYGRGMILIGRFLYPCSNCNGTGFITCSICNGTGTKHSANCYDTLCTGSTGTYTTEKNCTETPLPTKYEDEEKTYNLSDEASVELQGYTPGIEKRLIKIESKYETAITGDNLSNELVQTGDVLTYAINVKNDGETNIYKIFEIEDTMEEGLDTGTTTHIAVTNSGWDGSDPTYKTEQLDGKNDSVQNGGRYIGSGEKSDDLNFMAHVNGEPGGHTKNTAYLKAFHNRNKVKFETDEQDSAENDIDTYSVSVNKYITKVQSRQKNSVAGSDGSGLVDLGDSRKTNKGEAVIVDRGDIVTFKIEITDDHDNTNIWKVVLEDVYKPDELALKEYRSEDSLFEVNGSGGNIELIYNNNPIDEPNTSNPHLEAGGGVRSVELDFIAIEGAELLKKGDIYENKVSIKEAFNRNHIEILQYSSTGGTHESSDKCTVRQINAVIDKYVSKVFGGIEQTVYESENRKRKSDTNAEYERQERFKEQAQVAVERGDEITYTFKIRNTGEGIITVMKLEDVFDKELIFTGKFIVVNSKGQWNCSEVQYYDENKNLIQIEYNGLLNPGDEDTLKLIFVMTNEPDDKTELYGRDYVNTLITKEIQNINSWTWNNNGGPNTPYTTVIDNYNKDQCYLNLLQNGDAGIPSNMSSSDYVYMQEYKVELEKYVINVEHTNDDDSKENYNNEGRQHYENGEQKAYDNAVNWVGNNNAETNRENMDDVELYNTNKTAKGQYKETYPVQVEKNDIVTYEIKIKNTNDESIPGETSIYALDIADIFSSEDGSTITNGNIGLELLEEETKLENNGQLQILGTSTNKNEHLFKFTPNGQCDNSGKSKTTKGYGIGVGEEATFRIVVKVTRSNMYLYELRNTAIITNVYNRNNNIGNEDQDKYTYTSTDTGRTIVDAYRVTNGNRAYITKEGSIVEQLSLNGLEQVNGITVANRIADADYINLKDLIISGYVWDDTDIENNEDGLMTWGTEGSKDTAVDAPVYVYLYRLEPSSVGEYPNESTLVMKTKVDENGYYIFGTKDTEVFGNRVTVNQMYRFEPTMYKKPQIKVNGNITKDTEEKEIYKDNFTNYRIVKAPNKDYNSEGSTTRYWINEYKGYYQYYVEFEYNGMKYTHTVYASNSELDGDKGNKGNENNQDGQYNLNTDGRATELSEKWLPWRTSTKDNSEYYEIDSNSAEFKSVREAFNNQFETIAYNRGLDSNDNETTLEYAKSGHVSTLNYTENLYIRARSFVTNWIDSINHVNTDNEETYHNRLFEQYSKNPDYTNTLFFWDSNNTTRTPRYTNTVGTTEETEYLKYINLGLKQRPTLDLELTKDVYDVQVDINEKTMVYDYSSETIDRGPLARKPDDGKEYLYDKNSENYVLSDNDQTHVYYYKNAQGYQKTGYQLNMYYSDWAYRYTDYANEEVQNYKYGIEVANSEHNNDDEASHSELNVQITYKYTITNRSAYAEDNKGETIIGAIKEIVDYYQSDLIPNSVGTYVINRNGKYTPVNGEYKNESGYVLVGYDSKYTNINGNTKEATSGDLGKFKTCYIYSVGNYETTKIPSNDYTNVIAPEGHSKDFELEDERLYPGDSVDIYLTFTVSRQALNDNRKLDLDNKTKYNVAEINAFSSYYSLNEDLRTEWSRGLTTPGLVDKDSNPGNTPINDLFNIDNYEDDTFKVDITTTLDHDARLIDGIVWEDVNYGDKGTAIGKTITETQQVVGDGLYYSYRNNTNQDHDCLVDGVKVELIELITVGDKVYEDRANVSKSVLDTKSSSNEERRGYYNINGFIPGNYIVRFTYGNKTEEEKAYTTYQYKKNEDGTIEECSSNPNNDYNGHDYKSTQYQAGINENYNDGYITNIWHDMISEDVNGLRKKDEKEDKYIDGIHISDARDDEVRRLQVIAYSRTINNEVAEILNTKNLKDTTFTGNTYMFADTAKLQIELEHLKYVESDGFENANGENNKDAKYNEVAIYHGKVDKGNNEGKFVVGTYYKIDAFGNRIPDKAYDENLKLNGNDEPNQHKIKYYDLNNNSAEGGLSQQLANYTHWVADIDFGMEFRPTTNISMYKMISGIKVQTADGETIVEVEYEPTTDKDAAVATNIIKGAEHIQHVANTQEYAAGLPEYLNNYNLEEISIPSILRFIYEEKVKNKQGFYYINIDEDLMQGAVVTINYSISVMNKSQVDTLGYLTAFQTGEQIYNETLCILSENSDSSYNKFAENYNYLGTKQSKEIPTYDNGKLNATDNNKGYNNGHYLGATYYSGKYHDNTYVVETRVDQLIDYVDNDLTFREEDNSTENSTWRTVSLSELAEGEIQKDVVGQENANNTYTVDMSSLNYVSFETSGLPKNISVNNVGNMLSDGTYRIKNLPSNTSSIATDGTYKDDTTHAIYHANVQGTVTVNGDKVVDNATGLEVTIMDEKAREYVTEQKNNIVLSVPDENPDLYTYLIPEKTLNGSTLKDEFYSENEENINTIIDSYKDVSENTRTAAKTLWKEFNYYYSRNTNHKNTYKWFSNFINIILNDSNTESSKNDYKVAGKELLKRIVKEEEYLNDGSVAGKGTYNGKTTFDGKYFARENTKSSARINLTTTRTISPDTDTEDLSFENIAEIIQFSNEAGRKDEYTTVGDAAIWRGAWYAAVPSADASTDSCGDTTEKPVPNFDKDSGADETKYNEIYANNGVGGNYKAELNNKKARSIETYDADSTEVILLSPPTGASKK